MLLNVLSKEEIKLILKAHSNVKHKMMLSLIYSYGLYRSELINLKPINIDLKRNIVMFKKALDENAPITPLSPIILEMLRNYYRGYKPKIWLFEEQKKAMHTMPKVYSMY
ncbi:MAG: hypothetical protein RI980_838 [Bacteroidota bacterium]